MLSMQNNITTEAKRWENKMGYRTEHVAVALTALLNKVPYNIL